MITNSSELTFALEEEIGNTDLFSGRKADLEYLFRWLELVRKKTKPSIAILARRKKGKTALVQRFYNLLFNWNDPQIVPFYYKVREAEMSRLDLADNFYRSFLSQYAAFKTRNISIMKSVNPYSVLKEIFKNDEIILSDIKYMEIFVGEKKDNDAWEHAAWAGERISVQKDERIIQILDEFQYLNDYIYIIDGGIKSFTKLCGTYHHVGASKISPVIVTGSYVARLSKIISRMTGRYEKIFLKNLPEEEALETVYTYSRCLDVPVTTETAAYIAKISDGDPFYISRFFNTGHTPKDLTDIDCINDIVFYETRTVEKESGYIADMWREYLDDATQRINDINGKKIILYLVKYNGEDRTRKEIMDDLKLDMTEEELGQRLKGFIEADIISHGKTHYDYRGLGDRYFNIIFRSLYQKEIDGLDLDEIRAEYRKNFKSLLAGHSVYKGNLMELKVLNILLDAMTKKTPLSKLLGHYIEGYELAPSYEYKGKKRFNTGQSDYIEVDIYLHTEKAQDNDFIIEVKNWEKPVSQKHIDKFIATKNLLEPTLKSGTGFIFYSQKSLSKKQVELLKSNGIMIMYGNNKI
jgi:DNA-binding Lrp family transcriptional regulator